MDRDYNNYKPYRTKAQRALARASAMKCADGAWRSDAPVSFHKVKPGSLREAQRRLDGGSRASQA